MTASTAPLLGVNIDHVATLRQARHTPYPAPIEAAFEALAGGADFITVHLREDRRHIQDADVWALRERLPGRLNLEMAVTDEMVDIAARLRPSDCCLVPERRAELTTEGGLDVAGQESRIGEAVARLAAAGVQVSLFIDPDPRQLDAARRCGAPLVELHTGRYAETADAAAQAAELDRIRTAVAHGRSLGLTVNAGHGLNLANVAPIAALPGIAELNIGHALIARAVFVGLRAAVAEMRAAIVGARVIAGIGVDIVAVARIARMVERHGEHFARRLLAESELADYRVAPSPAAFMAKRFAAKEAFGKALGTGIAQGVTLPQIAVAHDAAGRPILELTGAAAEHCARRGIVAWHLSLADEQEHAVAMVVLERA